ncbi:MAG: alpha/beta hydrolase fold domain-containing protein [Bacteroidia bacterium]|jgi:dienelactone hydrolase|nr:alpha/beta hydrolase fold domain-containing protein [Bacteroidia bacterium]
MKQKLSTLILLLIVFHQTIFAQPCTNDSRYTELAYFDSTALTVAVNIQYGNALDYQGNPYPLRMDLYYPNINIDTARRRPFIMMFHGGGFSSGDKQSGDIRDVCIQLALRGFVCASVNYRLGHDFSEYEQFKARYRAIQDGHAAMRYIVNNASTVRVDTSWLFVGGQSAGALLALGMVYTDVDEVDSIANFYQSVPLSSNLGGLYTSGNNLTNTYQIKGIFNNWGGVAKNEIDRDEMIPTIAFHGELDDVVRIDADTSFSHYTLNGSRAIHQQLMTNNICSELTIDTLGGHGIFRNQSTVFRAQRASCFFKSIFCNQCTPFFTTDSIPTNCSLKLSVSQPSTPLAVVVSPNPFESSFIIEGIQQPVSIILFDVFGKIIHQQTYESGLVRTDVQPGIYFLHVQSLNQRKQIIKLVKN